MTCRTWFFNGFLYLKFYLLAYVFRHFNRAKKNDRDKRGYYLTFEAEFDSPVDWNKWKSSQPSGNVQCDAIYKESQVTQNSGDLIFTTDSNSVSGEPAVKSGGLYSWKFLNLKYGYFETREKLAPGGINYWNAFWLSRTDA